MSADVLIRSATLGDAEAIASFQCAMAQETEEKQLQEEVVLRAVRRALEDPNRGEYLVAEQQGRAVASLMLTREWSDWRDGWWIWIQSVYVAHEARRRGIYRALYARVHERALAAPDVLGIRLYVEEDNARARATYADLGMECSSYRFYEADLGRLEAADRPSQA